MLYTYTPKGSTGQEYVIYFWQGRASSQDEKAASALKAKALDDEYDDRPVQVRGVFVSWPPLCCEFVVGSRSGARGPGQ
jgi:hypothetical protein